MESKRKLFRVSTGLKSRSQWPITLMLFHPAARTRACRKSGASPTEPSLQLQEQSISQLPITDRAIRGNVLGLLRTCSHSLQQNTCKGTTVVVPSQQVVILTHYLELLIEGDICLLVSLYSSHDSGRDEQAFWEMQICTYPVFVRVSQKNGLIMVDVRLSK